MSDNYIEYTQDIQPLGIGYLRLLINSHNKAEDYIFLDVNEEFEKLTSLHREDVIRKKTSEIFREMKQGSFDWMSYYEKAVYSGKTQETTQWITEAERYLTITVIPVDQMSFMIVVREKEEESTSTNKKKKLPLELEYLDAVFNSTNDAVSLLEYSNGEYHYVRNNAMHQKYTGFSSIEGLDLFEVVGEEVGQTLQKLYEQSISTGLSISYEQEFGFEPGKRVWKTIVTPLYGQNGKQYLLCSSEDASELKQMEKENLRLTQRLQAMFNQHSAIMLIIEPISGKIMDANPAACEYYGYSKEEFKSLLIQDINMLPPDEVKKFRLMTHKKEQLFNIFPHRLKSGDIRMVDVYSCPIDDGENKLLYSIIFDATDREVYRNELFKEKELLKTTLQSIGDGVVTTDNRGRITSLNAVAQELTGWDNTLAVGRPFADVFILQNEETGQPVESPIQKVLETGRIIGLTNHTELVNLKGGYIPIADSAAPIKTRDGNINGVVMVFRDVSDEKEHSKQIQVLSYHDALTGLYNRRYVEESLSKLVSAENLPLTVIMGDVNGLKITNDVFGHKAGDSLLQHVAGLLKKHCNEDALIARWGGDEFVVFMPKTSLKLGEEVIQRIKSDPITVDESDLQLSISLGCAVKDTMQKSVETALKEAEEYMYHQKLLEGKSYRNAIINTLLVTLYEKSMETEEHSKRMETYCHSIGRSLRLSSKELDELSLLALLHDIGKVGINQDILKKTDSLTTDEWEEMKRHPEIGYRIAQATPELAIVSDYILSHHERWDGKGYPRGLKGKEIPLPCRILAVTDAFDAMTSDRVYRKAMSKAEAIAELEKNAGIQFDPAITSLFLEIIKVEKDYYTK